MSIPATETAHWKICDRCGGCASEYSITCEYHGRCAPDCPACAVEANNKAWARYLEENKASAHHYTSCVVIQLTPADWEQIKKLAEEKVE